MPATIVRGSASPMSTFKCSSLSAPFTASADLTSPTRKSTFAKSSIDNEIAASGEALTHQRRLAGLFGFFEFLHFLNGWFGVEPRKHRRDLADLLPAAQRPAQERICRGLQPS